MALAEADRMIFMPESFVRVDAGVVNSGAWWGSADIVVPLAEVSDWRVKIAVNKGEELCSADIVVPLAEVSDWRVEIAVNEGGGIAVNASLTW